MIKSLSLKENLYSLEEILSFITNKSMTKCPKWLVIDYSSRMLLQILGVKNCGHILVVHLISSRWCGTKKDDVVFIISFHPYGIHNWWQNDVEVQNIIWKCD